MAMKTAAAKEKVGRVGQRRQVVIPREMLELFRIKEGDFVAFRRHAEGVLIKPKRMVDPDDTLAPEEWALVEKAWREVRAGRHGIPLAQLKNVLARRHSFKRRKAT